MLSNEDIKANYQDLLAKVESLADHPVTIIPVTKKHRPELYQVIGELGITQVGENRVQELQEKFTYKKTNNLNLNIHFIGPLQKNKVKYLAGEIASLDSVASLSLLKEIEKKWAAAEAQPIKVLLQINSTGEENKFGIPINNFADICDLAVATLDNDYTELEGIMTMGPTPAQGYQISDQAYIDDTRAAFEKARILYQRLQEELDISLTRLSMGMSHDFHLALEEGANEIRVGSVLFGPRPL